MVLRPAASGSTSAEAATGRCSTPSPRTKAGWIGWVCAILPMRAAHPEGQPEFHRWPARRGQRTGVSRWAIDRLCQINAAKSALLVCVYAAISRNAVVAADALEGAMYRPTARLELGLSTSTAATPWVSGVRRPTMCDINDILYVGRSRGHWLLKPYWAAALALDEPAVRLLLGRPAKRAGGQLIDNVGPLRAIKQRYAASWSLTTTTPTRARSSHQAAM